MLTAVRHTSCQARLWLLAAVVCSLLSVGESFQGLALSKTHAFHAHPVHSKMARKLRASRSACSSLAMGPLDGWISAAKYRETCPPQSCVEQLLLDQIRNQDVDPSILHWAHPATMLLLVAPAVVYAAYLGWQIRLDAQARSPVAQAPTQDASKSVEEVDGIAENEAAASTQEPPQAVAAPAAVRMSGEERRSAGSKHAIVMSVASLFSVFGIQGGLGSMLLAGKPILESPHAASGFIFAALLGLQGGIASQMGSNKMLRSAHAVLGSGLVAVFVLHAGLGLGLGLSFSHPTGYEEPGASADGQVALLSTPTLK